MAKKRENRPTYQTKRKHIDVGVHDFMRTLEMMKTHRKYQKFKSAVAKRQVRLSVPPKTVNFMKKFVFENKMHEHPLGAKIVNMRGETDDPNDCNFGH